MANPNERPMKTTDVGGRQLPYPQGWNPTGGIDGLGDWEASRVENGKTPVIDAAAAALLQAIVTALAGALNVNVGNLTADQLIHGPVTATQGPPGAQAWPVADADALAKLEQVRSLLAGTLAVGDAATLAKVDAVRALLAGTLTVADANSLAKLEAIRLLLAGTLAVDDANGLAKLEAIRQLLAGTVAVADANTLAKVEQVRALLAGTLSTQLSGRNVTGQFQTLAVDDLAGGRQLPNIPADATGAIITVEGGDIRVTWDGTAPTAATGHLATWGDQIPVRTRADLLAFRAIRTTATNGSLTITYTK